MSATRNSSGRRRRASSGRPARGSTRRRSRTGARRRRAGSRPASRSRSRARRSWLPAPASGRTAPAGSALEQARRQRQEDDDREVDRGISGARDQEVEGKAGRRPSAAAARSPQVAALDRAGERGAGSHRAGGAADDHALHELGLDHAPAELRRTLRTAGRTRRRTARRSTTCSRGRCGRRRSARGTRAAASGAAQVHVPGGGDAEHAEQVAPTPSPTYSAPVAGVYVDEARRPRRSARGSARACPWPPGMPTDAADHRQHRQRAHRELHRPASARRCGARGRGSRRRCPPARRSAGSRARRARCGRARARAPRGTGSRKKTRKTIRNA